MYADRRWSVRHALGMEFFYREADVAEIIYRSGVVADRQLQSTSEWFGFGS